MQTLPTAFDPAPHRADGSATHRGTSPAYVSPWPSASPAASTPNLGFRQEPVTAPPVHRTRSFTPEPGLALAALQRSTPRLGSSQDGAARRLTSRREHGSKPNNSAMTTSFVPQMMSPRPVVRSPSAPRATERRASTQPCLAPAHSFAPVFAAAPLVVTPRDMLHVPMTTFPTACIQSQQQGRSVSPAAIRSGGATSPALPGPPSARSFAGPGGECDPDKYKVGTEVDIGPFRFRCSAVLGRGSFSEVWAGEVIEGPCVGAGVALKDLSCNTKSDLEQALLEVSLLDKFKDLATPQSAQAAPAMRIPRYFSHRVDRRGSGWRVRMAMERVPGESLDSWLKRPPPPGQDGPSSVRRGCAIAMALIRQLGPTLEKVSHHAWHRDINSHNVLLSDAVDGGKLLSCPDVDETSRRASFWLIDFGLAVDSRTWEKNWPTADVAGDCRYWPPSSFFMSFCGPEDTAAKKEFCNQYKTKLDMTGLGLTALEMLCSTALASRPSWGQDGLRGSWQRMLDGWQTYREDVTRWHTMIFQVFISGGDITPLYQQLAQEQVVDRVVAHIADVRALLRACVQRAEDPAIQRLLTVIAEMLDENSRWTMREVLEALEPPESSMHYEPIAAPSKIHWPAYGEASGQLPVHRKPHRMHRAGGA